MELDIPVVAYPPFKLRSDMIDKDPLIWEHLLEVYIELFKKLIILEQRKDLKLSPRSSQQLASFMKVYLYETSEESSKIFSLGAINPDIVKNQKTLKLIVFAFIKTYTLEKLQLTGSSIWDFCKVYVKLAAENVTSNQSLININVVRRLLEGNDSLNRGVQDHLLVRGVQDHLVSFVSEKKFNRYDLETLYVLLGGKRQGGKQKGRHSRSSGGTTSGSTGGFTTGSTSGSTSGATFSQLFVNDYWVNLLDELYNNGESIHSNQCFELMLISMVSLESSQIANLIKTRLKVSTMKQLVNSHPLLAKIVLSKRFRDMNPDIGEKLSFKKKKKQQTVSSYFDEDKIKELSELFPQLTVPQIKTLLIDNKGEVSSAVNKLLENPEEANSVQEYKEKPLNVVEFELNKNTKAEVQFGKKEKIQDVLNPDSETKEEIKKRSLERALRMMYESDEDEPDDTYVDQELTAGPALGRRPVIKDEDLDDSTDEYSDSKDDLKKQESLDTRLFLIYKSDPDLFATRSRHTNYRGQLKSELGWADEQIEGWARMLERNPHKYRLLEQQQIESGGSLNAKVKPRTKWSKEDEDDEERGDSMGKGGKRKGPRGPNRHPAERSSAGKAPTSSPSPSPSSTPSGPSDKKQQRDKSKYKAKRGNHSRKSGHDKKMTKMGID